MTRCFAGLLCLAASAAAAGVTVVELDPAQTHVDFTLSATLHTVHGTFRLKRGQVRFDPATGKADGTLVVDATTGQSGNDGRDRKMHQDILESARYPEIVFTAERVEGLLNPTGPSQLQVHGQFQIHGASHPLTLAVQTQSAPDQLTAITHITVPYQQWGMKNPSTFVLRVGDKVEIEIRATARVSTLPQDR